MIGDPREAPGPMRAHQIRDGEPYELRNGHPIRRNNASGLRARARIAGGRVLATDPEVAGAAGLDVGFSFNGDANLRALDIATGVGDGDGWMRSAPPLAVEYADHERDEADLQAKVVELLAAGTRYFWVVRLTGALRVEVYVPGEAMRVVNAGDELTAPGVLRNPVPVRAMVDDDAANTATLRNLANAEGYASVEALRRAMRQQREAIALVLQARGLMLEDPLLTRLRACRDPALLGRWLVQSVTAATAEAALD